MMAEDLPFAGRNVIVAGNGPSAGEADPWRVDLSDPIVRINNFFFEPDYQFGRRVDLLQVGGDRWVFPFYARTVKAIVGGPYDIAAWSSHQPRVAASARRLRLLEVVPFQYKDEALRRAVGAIATRHGKTPTTGILAIINAHALGAVSATLAGIDLYATPSRYGLATGAHARSLYAEVGEQGYNERFHSREVDLEVLDVLQKRDDFRLYRAVDIAPMLTNLDLAPLLAQPAKLHEPKSDQTSDWVPWAGLYPIALMKVLRRTRELYKRVTGQL